jgi:hypothetical protein
VIDVIVSRSRKDHSEGRVFFVHSLSPEYSDQAAPCPHYLAPGLEIDPDMPVYKT